MPTYSGAKGGAFSVLYWLQHGLMDDQIDRKLQENYPELSPIERRGALARGRQLLESGEQAEESPPTATFASTRPARFGAETGYNYRVQVSVELSTGETAELTYVGRANTMDTLQSAEERASRWALDDSREAALDSPPGLEVDAVYSTRIVAIWQG